MIVPDVVDGPQVIFAHHGADAFDGRDGRSHTGFGVEAVSAAAAAGVALLARGLSLESVLLPIAGSYVLIRPGHFNPPLSGTCIRFPARRRYHVISRPNL